MKIAIKNFNGVEIPRFAIGNKDIPPVSKAAVGLINAYPNICIGTLSRMIGVTAGGVCGFCKELIRIGIIEKTAWTSEELKAAVISKKFAYEKCDWCGKYTVSLEEHHWPEQRKHGGENTVFICGTCHRDYHALQSCFTIKGTK